MVVRMHQIIPLSAYIWLRSGFAAPVEDQREGEAAPSSTARLTRKSWPSEDTAYCCLLLATDTGPSAMRTGNRAAGVPVSRDCPSAVNFTGAAIILLSSDT